MLKERLSKYRLVSARGDPIPSDGVTMIGLSRRTSGIRLSDLLRNHNICKFLFSSSESIVICVIEVQILSSMFTTTATAIESCHLSLMLGVMIVFLFIFVMQEKPLAFFVSQDVRCTSDFRSLHRCFASLIWFAFFEKWTLYVFSSGAFWASGKKNVAHIYWHTEFLRQNGDCCRPFRSTLNGSGELSDGAIRLALECRSFINGTAKQHSAKDLDRRADFYSLPSY